MISDDQITLNPGKDDEFSDAAGPVEKPTKPARSTKRRRLRSSSSDDKDQANRRRQRRSRSPERTKRRSRSRSRSKDRKRPSKASKPQQPPTKPAPLRTFATLTDPDTPIRVKIIASLGTVTWDNETATPQKEFTTFFYDSRVGFHRTPEFYNNVLRPTFTALSDLSLLSALTEQRLPFDLIEPTFAYAADDGNFFDLPTPIVFEEMADYPLPKFSLLMFNDNKLPHAVMRIVCNCDVARGHERAFTPPNLPSRRSPTPSRSPSPQPASAAPQPPAPTDSAPGTAPLPGTDVVALATVATVLRDLAATEHVTPVEIVVSRLLSMFQNYKVMAHAASGQPFQLPDASQVLVKVQRPQVLNNPFAMMPPMPYYGYGPVPFQKRRTHRGPRRSQRRALEQPPPPQQHITKTFDGRVWTNKNQK